LYCHVVDPNVDLKEVRGYFLVLSGEQILPSLHLCHSIHIITSLLKYLSLVSPSDNFCTLCPILLCSWSLSSNFSLSLVYFFC